MSEQATRWKTSWTASFGVHLGVVFLLGMFPFGQPNQVQSGPGTEEFSLRIIARSSPIQSELKIAAPSDVGAAISAPSSALNDGESNAGRLPPHSPRDGVHKPTTPRSTKKSTLTQEERARAETPSHTKSSRRDNASLPKKRNLDPQTSPPKLGSGNTHPADYRLEKLARNSRVDNQTAPTTTPALKKQKPLQKKPKIKTKWRKYIHVDLPHEGVIRNDDGDHISDRTVHQPEVKLPLSRTLWQNHQLDTSAQSRSPWQRESRPKRLTAKLKRYPREITKPSVPSALPSDQDSNDMQERFDDVATTRVATERHRASASRAASPPSNRSRWWDPSVSRLLIRSNPIAQGSQSTNPSALTHGRDQTKSYRTPPRQTRERKKAEPPQPLPASNATTEKTVRPNRINPEPLETLEELAAGIGARPRRSSPKQSMIRSTQLAAKDQVSARRHVDGLYRRLIDEVIQARWLALDVPPAAYQGDFVQTSTVDFIVKRSGRVVKLRLRRTSGQATLDQLALSAIPKRLPKIPGNIKTRKMRHRYTFKYIYGPAITP